MTITVFQIVEKLSLENLEKKLKNKKKTDKKSNPSNGELVDLQITIDEVKNDKKQVFGKIRYDHLHEYTTREGNNVQVITKTVDFTFLHGSGLYLIIHAGVKEANLVAHYLSRLAFIDRESPILTCNIFPPSMQKFLDANKHTVIACSWDELNIPSLTGANVMGGGIEKSKDFKRFDEHGMKKSIRLKLLTENISLSINRQAGVYFYTKLDRHIMEQFIKDKIIPLCN